MSDSEKVDLELRFMKLERFVHELSDVVAAQGRAIDALKREIERLRAALGNLDEEAGHERPPHY